MKPPKSGCEFRFSNPVDKRSPDHDRATEAVSLIVDCENRAEVDALWSKLTAGGGSESQCGWLKDKFGLSWQIVPRQLVAMVNDPDKAKAARVLQALLKMGKINIAGLQRAYEGRSPQ